VVGVPSTHPDCTGDTWWSTGDCTDLSGTNPTLWHDFSETGTVCLTTVCSGALLVNVMQGNVDEFVGDDATTSWIGAPNVTEDRMPFTGATVELLPGLIIS
jgi:hypothetical protein